MASPDSTGPLESPKSELAVPTDEKVEGKHLSAGKCIKLSGYLLKKKKTQMMWQKRFVSLDKGYMTYFFDSSEYTRDLKGTIKMSSVIHTAVLNLDPKWSVFSSVKGGCQFETHLDDGRVYYWATETPQLCQQWVEALFSWSSERHRDHTVVKLDKVVNEAEAETADMKGYLKKKNPGFNFKGLGTYKKRYFVLNLKSKTLKWWESEKECGNGDPEKGLIDLRDIKDIKEAEVTTLSKLNPSSKAGCEFEITMKTDAARVYHLVADSPGDMKLWMESIFKLPPGFDKLDDAARANARDYIWGYHDNMAKLQSVLGVDWYFDCDYALLGGPEGAIDADAKSRVGQIVFAQLEHVVNMLDHFCRREPCLKSLQDTVVKRRICNRVGWSDTFKGTSFHQPLVEDGVLYIQRKADNFWLNLSEIGSPEFETLLAQQLHGFEQLTPTLAVPALQSLDLRTCLNFVDYAEVYAKQRASLASLTGSEWSIDCDYASISEHKELDERHRYQLAEVLWGARLDAIVEFFRVACADAKYKQSLLSKVSKREVVLFREGDPPAGRHQQVLIDDTRLVFQTTMGSLLVNLSELSGKETVDALLGEPKKPVKRPSVSSTGAAGSAGNMLAAPGAAPTSPTYKPSISQAQPSVNKKPGLFSNLFNRGGKK